jgi:hypothetical protein
MTRLRDAVRQSVQDPELVRAFTAAGAPVAHRPRYDSNRSLEAAADTEV